MRTISLRLDDKTDELLRQLCTDREQSQTDVIKDGLLVLARQTRRTPGELAEALGLIGLFDSGRGDVAERHREVVKDRLRAKRAAEERHAIE
ncbi:MAG: ribbon-helix-helix protein, CopG family [Gemmatimonadaceae bacterium]